MTFRLGVSFGHGLRPSEVLQGSKYLEKNGLDAVFVSESVGFDALALLGAIAAETASISIGSGIVNVYTRTPVQLAMAAATINELSSGRFILGIGASSSGVVSNWHGLPYTPAIKPVESAIDAIKSKLNDSGFVSKMGLATHGKIILAAVGERMSKVAKEKADGVLYFLRPLSVLRHDCRNLATDNFKVFASVVACVSRDSALAENKVRRTVAYYIANGPAYRKFIEKHLASSLPQDVISTIYSSWHKGKHEESASAVPQKLLDEVTLFGTPEECREKIERNYASIQGLDTLLLQFNAGSSSFSDSLELIASISKS